jgi:3-deoxy-D-manno-octulosonate 8-phosphate phosphatase KdsC-like HAD superfamily phosphatase
VANRPGGAGAAREVIERILRVQGRWQNVVDAYLSEPSEVGSTPK